VPDDPEVDALYALPAGEFVAARDGLARARRQAGDRPGADAVRQLRRPTVVAWVLNQLARDHADAVADLLDLGREAAAAQRQALAGDATDLRDVDRRRRAAVAALVAAAEPLTGGSRSQLDEVEASVQAASLDPDGVGESWRAGRLAAAIPAASGFDPGLAGWGIADAGSGGADRPAPSRPARKRAAPAASRSAGGDDAGADARAAAAARAEADWRGARDEARRTAEDREREADEADEQLAALRAELARLHARVDDAAHRAAAARARAQDAHRDLQRVERRRPG
jgi:hypothetical protein